MAALAASRCAEAERRAATVPPPLPLLWLLLWLRVWLPPLPQLPWGPAALSGSMLCMSCSTSAASASCGDGTHMRERG